MPLVKTGVPALACHPIRTIKTDSAGGNALVISINGFEKRAGRVISKDNPILHCSGKGVRTPLKQTI
jgi:hypothetical protein